MDKKKIRLYEVRKDSLVYAISFVESPAIESNFVYLSKEEEMPRVFLESDDRHLVYGAVLIPDKPIYRYDETEEYYIRFPQETIEELAHNYLKDDNIYSFTKHHEEEADNIAVVESWVKSSENDKSVDLGLDVPIGSWIIGAKVNNEELWNEVKKGSVKGFSVESFLNFEEIKPNKQNIEMNKEQLETIEVNESFWTRIVEVIKEALKRPEESEEVAETESVNEVEDIKEDVVEVKEEQEEMEVTEVVEEEPQAIADEVVEDVVDNATTEEEVQNDLQVIVDELNQRIDELNVQIDELKKENQKLSKKPSVNPINTKSENFGSESKFDRMLSIMNGSAFKK